MTPHARVEYAAVGIEGFTEQMALATAAGPSLALDVDGRDCESLTTSAGTTSSSAPNRWSWRMRVGSGGSRAGSSESPSGV